MPVIYANGPIWTGTGEAADWVAVEGSRIAGVGVGPPPEGDRIDLDGRARA